jgi:hypothetical protein
MAISFVGSTSTASTTNDASYTLTKPSGVQSGDFMIGVVATWPGADQGERNVTAPSGWTIVDEVFASSSSGACQLTILTRTAGSSEPASWSGGYSSLQTDTEATIVVAYRGVDGLDASTDTATRGSATSYTVGPATNSSSSNWRVTVGAYVHSALSSAIQSTETLQRGIDGVDDGTAVQVSLWDSNGAVASGSHSRTISRGSTWTTSAAWIGFLDADTESIPGTLAAAMPLPTMTMQGQQGYQGSMAVTIPVIPSVSMAGIASPPAGTLDTVVMPEVSIDASEHAIGTLDVVPAPVVDVVGETRKFGIRVVTPGREVRVIVPRLGAVD